MKINFLILVHRSAGQCQRLIDNLLSCSGSTVFVHVDLKAETVYSELKQLYANQSNVKIISERYKVYWGSYNQICATLALIKESSKREADYFCLLSGQDFPIKPIKEFADFLNRDSSREYLVNFKLPDAQWGEDGGLGRLNRYWINVISRDGSFFRNKLGALIYSFHKLTGYRRKLKYTYYGGSNWFNLTNNSVKYILKFLDEHPDYLLEFKYSRSADEMFVQSIVLNSPYAVNAVSNDLRFVDWISGPEFPRTFRGEDFERLVTSGDKFFARKFDETVDLTIIDKLNEYCRK